MFHLTSRRPPCYVLLLHVNTLAKLVHVSTFFLEYKLYTMLLEHHLYKVCHAPIPGLTRLADPNRVRGARPYTGTLYFFFFLENQNIIYIYKRTTTGVVSIKFYTHILSPIYIYKNCTFKFTNQSAEPTCSEPLLVCWPSCMRKLSDVFSCTYTD